MTMTHEKKTTPGGRPLTRVVSSGQITKADADTYIGRAGPGGEDWDRLMLVLAVEKDIEVTIEARQAFSSKVLAARPLRTAVVMTSTPLRVLAGFLVRMGGGTKTKFFGTEAEGLAWLDTDEA